MKTFSIALLLLAFAFAARADDSRAKAVELARLGMLDKAVAMLERMWRETPADEALFGDLVTVLNWAGHHQRVVALAKTVDPVSLPTYALRAVAGSTRRSGNADAALKYYPSLLERDERSNEDYTAYALTLTDSGQPGQALSVAATAHRHFGASASNSFAQAYAQFRSQRYAHAISLSRQALALEPGHTDATRMLISSLLQLGATGVAQEIADEHSGSLKPEKLIQVANDRNATWVRWGALDQGKDPQQRFRDTDIALQRLETLQRNVVGRVDLPAELTRVIVFDKLVALRDRVRMDEVIALYRELLADDIPLPGYALRAVADAFLYVEEPGRAATQYRQVLESDPADVDARIGLFYALVEQDDFSSAREVIKQLVAELPRFRRSPDGRTIAPDYDWLEASITAAMLESYADRLELAVDQIRQLSRRAPYNARLFRELSTLYRWRGWADLALEEARIGRTSFPDDAGLIIAEASALMDLDRTREAETLASSLFHHYPENKAVQRLQKQIDAFHSPQLESYFSRARSSAQNLVRGEQSLAYGIRLDSTPISHHSRLFTSGNVRKATFFGERLRHERVALGYVYRDSRLRASLALTNSRGDIDEDGFTANMSWDANDHLWLGMDYESISMETPLRAAGAGDYADHLGLALGYNFHESRKLRLSLGRMDFSDGNSREFGSLGWEERWWSGPVYRLSTFVDTRTSRNSLEDATYFNPARDKDIDLTMRQRWKTWRHYRRSFHQLLDISLGRYDQSGFVDGTTWGIRYEHIFEHDQESVLSYGVRRAREFYDGQPEYVDEMFLRYQRIF